MQFSKGTSLLEKEGVIFKENGCMNMKKCQWEC